jgi:hypothetical protein
VRQFQDYPKSESFAPEKNKNPVDLMGRIEIRFDSRIKPLKDYSRQAKILGFDTGVSEHPTAQVKNIVVKTLWRNGTEKPQCCKQHNTIFQSQNESERRILNLSNEHHSDSI